MTKVVVNIEEYMEALLERDSEIKRLREALREIAEGDRLHFNNDEQYGVLFSVGHWGRVARAALGEGKE